MKDANNYPWRQPMLMNGLTLWKALEEKPAMFERHHSLGMRWHWKKREMRRRFRSWLREMARGSSGIGMGPRV